MPRGDLIKIRRGTAAQWTAANSILADGELGLETDTHKIKAGDGSTVWSSLPYISSGGGGGGGGNNWGSITGTLSDQTDLQTALDDKQPISTVLTNTTASFTTSLSSKLAGIENGAQVNTVESVSGKTGDVLLDKNDVGLGSVDNTSDLDKPISTATQTALDLKVSDADVRGGAVSLNARLGTISNFASPNAGGIVSGQYYDNSFQGTASSTLAGAANRIDLAPYYTSVTFSIDQIGCSVSTAVAGSLFKIVIYSTNSSGWPDTLLYESGDLSGATATFVGASLSFTFQSGVQYWVGVRHSSTCTLRTINVSSAVNLGLTSSTAANYATILRRTLTYATPATSPWNFTNSDRVANVTPPSIRFRAV